MRSPGMPSVLVRAGLAAWGVQALYVVVVLSFTSPPVRQRLEAEPLFQRIPAVRRGAYVGVVTATAIALAFPSALSIPYGLRVSVPRVAAALARRRGSRARRSRSGPAPPARPCGRPAGSG